MDVMTRALAATELKVIRRVRTPAGERRYKQPIGSIIIADGKLQGLELIGEYDGWDHVRDWRGDEYNVGQWDEDGRWYAIRHTGTDEWGEDVVDGDTEEEVYLKLADYVAPENAPKPSQQSKPQEHATGQTREEGIDNLYGWGNTLANDSDAKGKDGEFLWDLGAAYSNGEVDERGVIVAIQDRLDELGPGDGSDGSDDAYSQQFLLNAALKDFRTTMKRFVPMRESRQEMRAKAAIYKAHAEEQANTPRPVKLGEVQEGMWIRIPERGSSWIKVGRIDEHSRARKSFHGEKQDGRRAYYLQVTNRDKIETVQNPSKIGTPSSIEIPIDVPSTTKPKKAPQTAPEQPERASTTTPVLKKLKSKYEGWDRYKAPDGKVYDLGQATEDDGRWYATGRGGWDDIVADGDTKEEAYAKLEAVMSAKLPTRIAPNAPKTVVPSPLPPVTEALRRRAEASPTMRSMLGKPTDSTPKPKTSTTSTLAERKQKLYEAWESIAGDSGGYASLAKIRAAVGGTRQEQDEALMAVLKARDALLLPESNQKVLTREERAAAINVGNQDKHIIKFVRPTNIATGAVSGSSTLDTMRAEERIDNLRPFLEPGPQYNRGVAEGVRYARMKMETGGDPTRDLTEAEVAAKLRPRADLAREGQQALRASVETQTTRAQIERMTTAELRRFLNGRGVDAAGMSRPAMITRAARLAQETANAPSQEQAARDLIAAFDRNPSVALRDYVKRNFTEKKIRGRAVAQMFDNALRNLRNGSWTREQAAEDIRRWGRLHRGMEYHRYITLAADLLDGAAKARFERRTKSDGGDREMKVMDRAIGLLAKGDSADFEKFKKKSGMIALVPRMEDVERLAVDGGEPERELHTTLVFLGDADNYSYDTRKAIIWAMQEIANGRTIIKGRGFSVPVFNPDGEDPCVVVLVGGKEMSNIHDEVVERLSTMGLLQIPEQHDPWMPHITLKYHPEEGDAESLKDRVGEVIYDRIRVCFGNIEEDIPLVDPEFARYPGGDFKTVRVPVGTKTPDVLGLWQKGALDKPHKCEYCKAQATKYVLHSEGRAYIPACPDDLKKAKDAAARSTPGGEYDASNIDRIGDLPSKSFSRALMLSYKLRRVRTAAGARRFGVPIGSVIEDDGIGSGPAARESVARQDDPDKPARRGSGDFPGMTKATPDDRARFKEVIGKPIPPAWTDVYIADDLTSAKVLARGKDAKGRGQTIYSAAHTQGQAEIKFTRVKAFLPHLEKLDHAIERDAGEDDSAAALMLIRRMGMRPGSDKDTGADKDAHGATNLKVEHVTITDDGVAKFDFTGKKGVHIQLETDDPEIVEMLRPRLEGRKEGDRLFATDENKTRAYMRSTGVPQEFLLKDLRTVHANFVALRTIATYDGVPKTKTEFRKWRKQVAEAVSAELGNTPTLALSSYINPTVFSNWLIDEEWA